MTVAAQNIKPAALELGGKSPIVVFDDADTDKVVEWTLFSCFGFYLKLPQATSSYMSVAFHATRLAIEDDLRSAEVFLSPSWMLRSYEYIGAINLNAARDFCIR
ncbi:hypothetical protein L6452_02257 [Arctium lappa]|uniref:Uncharacterized protein n=1 Tax=Arctium lappa TaxID=4217 RepID=A0ACB9FK71_ARCLA|nr:hypothetical protein L6452_02257 [Arctium lappa]